MSYRGAFLALVFLSQAACSGNHGAGASDASTRDSAAVAPSTAISDASSAAPQDATTDAEGGSWVGSTQLNTLIYSEMESFRGNAEREVKVIEVGTLRWGEKTPVIPGVRAGKGCPEGWYALAAGGYVCGAWAAAIPWTPTTPGEKPATPAPPSTTPDRPQGTSGFAGSTYTTEHLMLKSPSAVESTVT